MLKNEVKILISLWHYLSYEDKNISHDEFIDMAFILSSLDEEIEIDYLKELDLKPLSNSLENILDIFEKELAEDLKIEILLMLFVFSKDDMAKKASLLNIFEKLSMKNYFKAFDDIFNKKYIENHSLKIKFFINQEINNQSLFEEFDFILFDLNGSYKIYLKHNNSLHKYSNSENKLLPKNRLININKDKKYVFKTINSKLVLEFDELLNLLKNNSFDEKKILKFEDEQDTEEHIKSLTIKNLYCGYDKNKSQTQNIKLDAKSGDLIAIIGPSGSGKSTLFKTLLGMNYIHDGEIYLNQNKFDKTNYKSIEKLISHIGYVSQQEVFVKELSVYDNLKFYFKLFNKELSSNNLDKKIRSVLLALGILEKINQKIFFKGRYTLSGGERKKLNIALELIKNPDILLIDEPTSGLSSQESIELIQLLKDLTLKGKIIITIIHQPSIEIYQKYNQVIVLNKSGYNTYSGNANEALKIFKHVIKDRDHNDPNLLLKVNDETNHFWNLLSLLQEQFGESK